MTEIEITSRYANRRTGHMEIWSAKSADGVWTYGREDLPGNPLDRRAPADRRDGVDAVAAEGPRRHPHRHALAYVARERTDHAHA